MIMNTRYWINSIPEINRNKLTLYSDLISQARGKGLVSQEDEYARKIRGYLECMKDSGTISESGLRALFLYYGSTRVDPFRKEVRA